MPCECEADRGIGTSALANPASPVTRPCNAPAKGSGLRANKVCSTSGGHRNEAGERTEADHLPERDSGLGKRRVMVQLLPEAGRADAETGASDEGSRSHADWARMLTLD